MSFTKTTTTITIKKKQGKKEKKRNYFFNLFRGERQAMEPQKKYERISKLLLWVYKHSK